MSSPVIAPNGGSGSGEPGIARYLQAVLPDPWLTLGTDTLADTAPSSSPMGAAGIESSPGGEAIVGLQFRAWGARG